MYLHSPRATPPPGRGSGRGAAQAAEPSLFFWVGVCGVKGQLIVGFVLKISLSL